MTAFALETPVAMLVFNRPDNTRRVFEAVAAARPPKLLVVADGPRADRPQESELCRRTRAVFDAVDWPCQVLTHYADRNLGCKTRILTGLDWVFTQVGEAIILEDDCLPEPTFFRYCQEMLRRYRDDSRVHMVRGGNFFGGRQPGPASYHFSRWYHIWGWATWARAWNCTDHAMRLWPSLRDSGWLERKLPLDAMVAQARGIFDEAYSGRVDTWEYHFTFMGWVLDALAISPSQNLITNIGFGPEAAHLQRENHPHARLPVAPMRFPLRHPRQVGLDARADLREWKLTYPQASPKPAWKRAGGRARRYLRKMGL